MSTDSPIKYNPDRVLTRAQKDINDDTRYWDWFDAWWDQDFSWGEKKENGQSTGLAKHIIEGSNQTLQDYWREEKDRLIDFAGRTWTRFHLPPHDRSGEIEEEWRRLWVDEETWEEKKWQNWYNAILKKLDSASKFHPFKPDTRAQLKGATFPDFFDLSHELLDNESPQQIKARTLHIYAPWAWFGSKINFFNAVFGPSAAFTNSNFSASVNFIKSHFEGRVSFTGACFVEGAQFERTTFSKNAFFLNSVIGVISTFDSATFIGAAFFSRAIIHDEVSFTEVHFYKKAYFNNTEFGEMVSFYKAEFFDDAEFSGKADLLLGSSSAPYPVLNFRYTKFFGAADFSNRLFPKNTQFIRTRFYKLAKFQGCTFHQDTSFAEAVFDLPLPAPNWLERFWLRKAGCSEEEIANCVSRACDEAENYQRAFQTLRLHMANLLHREQEMKFARLEITAWEQRSGSSDAHWSVRKLSPLYGLISNYGISVMRPLFWLTIFYALASYSYNSIAGEWANPGAAMAVAFQYSLPPISTFAAQFFAGEGNPVFINALLDHPLLTRFVMITHGVISLALVFFLLLALKRRFQIR